MVAHRHFHAEYVADQVRRQHFLCRSVADDAPIVHRDDAIAARRKEGTGALDRELKAIRDEGDARVAELRLQQEQFLAALAEAGERKLGDAVALYQRIVCEVVP